MQQCGVTSFPHPFGIPQQPPPDSRYKIPSGEQCIGAAVAGIDPILRFPVRHGEHNWMVRITSPAEAKHLLRGGFAFRAHAMADMDAFCWVCERDFDPDIAEGACLGDPEGRDIPTRAEWHAWTDDQKTAWIERMGYRT